MMVMGHVSVAAMYVAIWDMWVAVNVFFCLAEILVAFDPLYVCQSDTVRFAFLVFRRIGKKSFFFFFK